MVEPLCWVSSTACPRSPLRSSRVSVRSVSAAKCTWLPSKKVKSKAELGPVRTRWPARNRVPLLSACPVSWPAADAIVKEVEVFSVKVSGWSAAAARAVSPLAEIVAVPDSAFDGAALLVSVPEGRLPEITKALVNAGASVRSSALVGSHATRYTVAGGAQPDPGTR